MSSALVPDKPQSLVAVVKSGALTIGGSLGLIWAASIVNWLLFAGGLASFAIRPLSAGGLAGIAVAPFLHGSLGHLVANTIGFAMLAPLTMLRKRMDFWVVSVLGGLASGLGTWLIGGAGTVHLGASGIIFAYLGFLMARGFFERKVGAILLSLGVTWFFGSMVWGVFPLLAGAGISWQAHLFGFLGGIGTARLLGTQLRKKG